MAAYALTIFLSAFLLFQVQTLHAKWFLPWCGVPAGRVGSGGDGDRPGALMCPAPAARAS